MRLKIIACEVTFRELCYVVARAKNVVDLTFVTQGYHDNPEIGRERLQALIDAVEPGRFEAILLGYCLCNNLVVGLQAPEHTPLVIPRAHDCVTLFLGSKERYAEMFRQRPGTYYYTSGWLEYSQRGGERVPYRPSSGLGPRRQTYEELVEKYGEENAQYLLEFMGHWQQYYTHGVWIDFDFLDGLPFRERVKQICTERGWQYEEVKGDLSLLQRWVDGEWNEADFLIVQPGKAVTATYDEGIIAVS